MGHKGEIRPLTQAECETIQEEAKESRGRDSRMEYLGTRIQGRDRYPSDYHNVLDALRKNEILDEFRKRGEIEITEIGSGSIWTHKEPGIKLLLNEMLREGISFKLQVVDEQEEVLNKIKRELPGIDVTPKKLNIVYECIPEKADLCMCINVFWNSAEYLKKFDSAMVLIGVKNLLLKEYHAMFDNLVQCVKVGGYLIVDQVPRAMDDYSELYKALQKMNLGAYGLDFIDSVVLNREEGKTGLILRKT